MEESLKSRTRVLLCLCCTGSCCLVFTEAMSSLNVSEGVASSHLFLSGDKCASSSLTFDSLIICEVSLNVFQENLLYTNNFYVSLLQMLFQKWKLKPSWPGSMWIVDDIDRWRLSQEVGVLSDPSELTIKSMKKKQKKTDRQDALRKYFTIFLSIISSWIFKQ